MSQNDKILKALQSGNVLTPIQVLNDIGCLRLAARIKDLRDRGWVIKSEMVKVNGKRFSEYWM